MGRGEGLEREERTVKKKIDVVKMRFCFGE